MFKKEKITSTDYYIWGVLFSVFGFFSGITLIGILFGLPMFLCGAYFLYKARIMKKQEKEEQRAFEIETAEKTSKAIADGIAEGLRKARESDRTYTLEVENKEQ